MIYVFIKNSPVLRESSCAPCFYFLRSNLFAGPPILITQKPPRVPLPMYGAWPLGTEMGCTGSADLAHQPKSLHGTKYGVHPDQGNPRSFRRTIIIRHNVRGFHEMRWDHVLPRSHDPTHLTWSRAAFLQLFGFDMSSCITPYGIVN